jgi:hypothetical protein
VDGVHIQMGGLDLLPSMNEAGHLLNSFFYVMNNYNNRILPWRSPFSKCKSKLIVRKQNFTIFTIPLSFVFFFN